MELAGEFLAVGAAFVELREADGGVDGFFAQQVDQMRHERHVFPVANLFAYIAVFEFVLNEAGVKGVCVFGGGLEQRGFEGQDGFAVGTGAFGKEDDQRAVVEGSLNFIRGLPNARTAFAIHKQCAGQAREESEDGPAFHFAFSYEHRGGDGRDDEDIHVAQMIGDEQAAGGNNARGFDGSFENTQDAAGGMLQPGGTSAFGTIF